MAGRQHINLSVVQKTALNAAIATILGILIPILIALSEEERQHLRKMGEKRTGYVSRIYDVLAGNTTIIPDTFVMADFTADRDSSTDLTGYFNTFQNLCDLLSDSIMILGNQ